MEPFASTSMYPISTCPRHQLTISQRSTRLLNWLRKTRTRLPIFYILACRIGPFISGLKKKNSCHRSELLVNLMVMNGCEQSGVYQFVVLEIFRAAHGQTCRFIGLTVKNIEQYIQEDYKQYQPKTTYIAYGTDTAPSNPERKIPRFGIGIRKKS